MDKLINILKYNLLLLGGMVSGFIGCVGDGPVKSPPTSYIPVQANDDWEVSSPLDEGFDLQAIDRIYNRLFSENVFPTARSLLIVRNGRLVAEAYCKDQNDKHNFHSWQSATKSITSILLGIAIDRNFIESVDIPIYDFIPDYYDADDRKRSITLYHALTMQTGLNFDNDEHTNELFNCEGSSLEYVLHKGLRFTPGTSFYYNDGDPHLISGVIQEVSDMTLAQFANENLFAPLGISNFRWEKADDGVTFGAFGLWLTPRDMAKIGQMLLQGGVWKGRQIVSSEWIDESTRIYANTNYGYYWWITEPDTYLASGRGEQLMYVVPDRNLVVVLTTDSFSNENLSPGIRSLIYEVVNAII